jgi:hypothetical protein
MEEAQDLLNRSPAIDELGYGPYFSREHFFDSGYQNCYLHYWRRPIPQALLDKVL